MNEELKKRWRKLFKYVNTSYSTSRGDSYMDWALAQELYRTNILFKKFITIECGIINESIPKYR